MTMTMNNKSKRLLAAVMFTDMVGYTALMQENEARAVANRNRHRTVLKELTTRHKGEILQYYGDGTLIIFNSAVEAVECAVEVQTEMQKEPVIPLRIGIHTGDIVYNEEGIYGDGVNIASRIEGLAVPGSVLVSGKMADEIKNHPRIGMAPLGSFDLKNVSQPVEILAITNTGLTVPTGTQINGAKGHKVHSIAVLPFVNMSSDPENEYFSDGITEELLNALAKVNGLLVTARTSSFAFKNKHIDIREIGKQLGVRTVLEGSVRKAGNRVRITAQLINIDDGYHIWSETYDRQLEDIFEVQDEISLKIANRLRERLTVEKEDDKLVKPSTRNLEAYNIYLKALFKQRKWNLTDSVEAISLYEQAIAMDPGFAVAYAQLSGVYGYLGATGKLAPGISFPKSWEYAVKALELDKTLSESHLALANIYFWAQWNWKDAITSVNKSIKLNPSNAEAYQYKAMFLLAQHKFKEAKVNIKLSLQLDPFSGPAGFMLGLLYFVQGNLDTALAQMEKVLQVNPDFAEAGNAMGWILREMKEFDRAVKAIRKYEKVPGNEATALSSLGAVYADKGDIKAARKCLNKMLAMEKDQPDIAIAFAIGLLYAGLNDLDNMFLYFEKSFEAREGDMVFLSVHTYLYPLLLEDPRYKALIKKMEL